MNRHLFCLTLVVVVFAADAAWAQVGADFPDQPLSAQPPPPGPVAVPGPMPAPGFMTAPQAASTSDSPPPGSLLIDPPAQSPPPAYQRTITIPATPHSWWTASAEALWLERSVGSSVPLGFTAYNYASHAPPAVPLFDLYSNDVFFPLQTGVRLQIGGRISERSSIEATYWGLQQWSVGGTIYGDPDGETVLASSPWLQTPALVGGLDDFLGYTYASRVDNAEINQRITIHDYDPYFTFSWLWGFRYFRLSDDFTLSGSDILTGYYENLNYRTTNNLVGMQLGLQWERGWGGFQLISEAKVGLLANFFTQHGSDVSGGTAGSLAGFTPFDVSHSGSDLSALFELSIAARWRVSQYLWVKAGYQVYCVTGLALGPRQLGGFSHNGTVALDGLSLGLEASW
jgi:hypothetical protein